MNTEQMTLTCCQDHMLTENIWFVWSETSYSGDKRRCYRCGTNNKQQPNTEDRATQPMEDGGWVSQYSFRLLTSLNHGCIRNSTWLYLAVPGCIWYLVPGRAMYTQPGAARCNQVQPETARYSQLHASLMLFTHVDCRCRLLENPEEL